MAGPLPISAATTITITSPSVVGERRKGGPLFGRPEINCDRILAFVRDRARSLARSFVRSLHELQASARFILSLFIAESCLPPSLPSFLYFRAPPSAEILAVCKQYKTSLCTARWYFIVTYINDRRYKKARRKIGAPRTVLHIKAQEFNDAISSSVNDKRRLIRAS